MAWTRHSHGDDQACNGRAQNRTARFYLTAQSDKVALCERFGFVVFGEEFLDGGMPDLAMKNY